MGALAEEDLSTVNEKINEFDGFPFSIKEYKKVKSIKKKRFTRYSYGEVLPARLWTSVGQTLDEIRPYFSAHCHVL